MTATTSANVDRAEIVDEHGDPETVVSREDAVEQRRLARAEEAGEDGGGDESLRHGVIRIE